jgi:predicted dehydrogenase
MPFDRIRVGLIGYGVGKLYATSLRSVSLYYDGFPPVDLVSVATATPTSGERAVRHFDFERATTDYRELLAADDINTVVIATPIDLHREMLIEALRTGKAIYMDKPLTVNLDEARDVLAVANETGRDAQMIFEFRFNPALMRAHEMIRSGQLGEVYAFRLSYFRSSYTDPEKSLRWKASAKAASGVLNDLATHLFDLLLWLVGMPERVSAQTRTFIDTRPAGRGSDERVRVETEDHATVLCALPGGAVGTIEVGRLIAGAVNDMTVTIYGSRGSLKWNLMNPNYLYYADGAQPDELDAWRALPTAQRYPDAVLPGGDVPLGMMRFHVASMADFLHRTLENRPYAPDLKQGADVQALVEASQQAAAANTWVDVPEP